MDSESIANFCSITDATDSTAEYYLSAAGGDLDMAIGLFYESGGAAGGNSGPSGNRNIHEISAEMSSRNEELTATSATAAAAAAAAVNRPIVLSDSDSYDGEVIMSRPSNAATAATVSSQSEDEDDIVFNNSANTTTSRRLADLFRPPHAIMFNGTLEMARRHARENNRWLLVTVHAPTDFASQAMNRDLWNSILLQSFIKENFVFVQMIVGGGDERRYQSFYPYDGLYPHVALIDPRTGERVETLLVASIPVPGFKLISTDRDMMELLGEFIAEHPMDAVGDQRKRSTSSPKLETTVDLPEAKRSFVRDEPEKSNEPPAEAAVVIPEMVPNYDGPDAIQVQFRLPSGQKHRHRFNPKSKASEVFQTAAAVSQSPLNSFKLRTAEGELDEKGEDISKLHNTMLTIIK